jgi:hypothetical protein
MGVRFGLSAALVSLCMTSEEMTSKEGRKLTREDKMAAIHAPCENPIIPYFDQLVLKI